MRIRALVLLCVVVAVLSGIGLFTPFYSFRGGWLDGVFLVAIGVLVTVGLWRVSSIAERSVSNTVDSNLEEQLDEDSRSGRRGEH